MPHRDQNAVTATAQPAVSSWAPARIVPEPGGDHIEEILEAAGFDVPGLCLLVITFDARVTLAESLQQRVIYVVPPARLAAPEGRSQQTGSEAGGLPMSDGAFDLVLGYRLVRPGFDVTPLLREALRVARHDGSIVLVTDPRDFQSAPLPPAGPVYLAQRALAAAGLANARFSQHGAHSVAVIRRRDAR